VVGDNFAMSDEYGGIYTIDENYNTAHKRLDPSGKDVLIMLTDEWWKKKFSHPAYLTTTNTVFGSQNISFYFVDRTQFVYKPKIYLDFTEKGATMDDCLSYDTNETFGTAFLDRNRIEIYTDMIFKRIACKNSEFTFDQIAFEVDRAIRRVLAHEVGHILGIDGDYSCFYTNSNLMCYGCDPDVSGTYCVETQKGGQTYYYDTRFARFLYSYDRYTITRDQVHEIRIW